MTYTHIFFDLDGTLTDPGLGITNAVMYALARWGIRVDDRQALYPFIGPPLVDSFMRFYGFSAADARAAVDVYREYFANKGIFENEVYPGIPALLARLKRAGLKLVMATSKPEQFAVRIAEHFGIAAYFDCIAGAAMDETRTEKWEVVEYALDRCGVTDRAAVLMVGDREHDVRGAQRCGIRTLGVLYGYGSRAELEQAGAVAVAETVEAVGDYILDHTEDTEMDDFDARVREYARLLVREGVNLQPKQTLVISCPVDAAWFARLCAEAAYDAGCREVVMNWSDEQLMRMGFLRADDAVFDEYPAWAAAKSNALADEGAAFLSIHSADPESLAGVDPDRLRRRRIATGTAMKHFTEMSRGNRVSWCVAALPCPAWARKVFPALSEDEAMRRLWQEVLRAARADRAGASEAWRAHSAALRAHVAVLNSYNFKSLHYKNARGTDLTVELPAGHYWSGGEEKCLGNGVSFSPNIPTEEIFTLPKRDGVNGTVVASKPLSYNGNVIEGFRFTLKDGKITEVRADKGEDLLRGAISVDEGASFLGECALVPCDSPISRSGVLFYDTLFDENASCHFAFGSAYPCIAGAENMDADALLAHGVNRSITHVDFMIGTPDLSIVGTTHDGKEVPVFVDGNFAF